MASDPSAWRAEHQFKAKVFISYSRKDIAFADRLDAALKGRGFEPHRKAPKYQRGFSR